MYLYIYQDVCGLVNTSKLSRLWGLNNSYPVSLFPGWDVLLNHSFFKLPEWSTVV